MSTIDDSLNVFLAELVEREVDRYRARRIREGAVDDRELLDARARDRRSLGVSTQSEGLYRESLRLAPHRRPCASLTWRPGWRRARRQHVRLGGER